MIKPLQILGLMAIAGTLHGASVSDLQTVDGEQRNKIAALTFSSSDSGAAGGGGDVFQASNNVFTANNLITHVGTLTIGTNAVLTSYTNYNVVINALKTDGRNLLLFPKGGAAGIATLMLGANASTAWSSGGGYSGANTVLAHENGATYLDSASGQSFFIQRGNTGTQISGSASAVNVQSAGTLTLRGTTITVGAQGSGLNNIRQATSSLSFTNMAANSSQELSMVNATATVGCTIIPGVPSDFPSNVSVVGLCSTISNATIRVISNGVAFPGNTNTYTTTVIR
jgi:hypothetical protein